MSRDHQYFAFNNVGDPTGLAKLVAAAKKTTYFSKLKSLHQKYQNIGLEEQMLQAIYNAANYYRSIGNLKKWEYYLSELKVITDKIVYPFPNTAGYSILQENETDKLMKIECVKAVRDYDLFVEEDIILLTVVDYALPQGDQPETEVLFYSFVLCDHIFLKIIAKTKKIHLQYNVLICPSKHPEDYQQITKYLQDKN
jgi:hypothetical protein